MVSMVSMVNHGFLWLTMDSMVGGGDHMGVRGGGWGAERLGREVRGAAAPRGKKVEIIPLKKWKKIILKSGKNP